MVSTGKILLVQAGHTPIGSLAWRGYPVGVERIHQDSAAVSLAIREQKAPTHSCLAFRESFCKHGGAGRWPEPGTPRSGGYRGWPASSS